MAASKDSVTICVAYSLPCPKIIFTKIGSSHNTFGASLSFSLDEADSVTGTTYHSFHRKEITVDRFSMTRDPKLYCQDFVVLTLPRSTYRATSEVRDDNQQIKYLDYTEIEHLDPVSQIGIVSTFFVDSLSGSILFPEMRENVAPFPESISAVVLAQGTGSEPIEATLKTTTGNIISRSDSITPLKVRLEPGTYGNVFGFTERPDSAFSTYIARFRSDTLRDGKYELEFTSGGKSEKLNFHYSWLDKPLSLVDFTTALSLLKYIVPDSLYSLVNSGNEREKREKFESYWKSHDPTPNTAYNELETEFYERADYATEHFRTLVSETGAATDRGKAYILYGPPAKIKREFLSGGTYEIWYYPNLQSVLIFKEERFGEFKLYRTEKS
ncbi:MAG: GWxTD domain-containing protein [Bacteroidetes bacterium]|nr:GWxTD domain-containing protein [Bacteroidota bacterium]